MHPTIAAIINREKEALQEFQFSLKKAFDLLGNVYAPIFFCAAALLGIALPVFAWKSGGVLNALLGARGIGTLTSELTRGMWILVVALAVFFVANVVLGRLEGKMREVFVRLAHVCEIATLLFLSAEFLSIFFTHIILLFVWRLSTQNYLRRGIATVWFLGLVWMFFSLATDVALRVTTIGDMVGILAVCTLFFVVVTQQLFEKR